ncbi:hypothetical protein BDZ89DRAFT_1167989 [Hymenopellis radicata]|nr:hypothetical protein BDZ89DRAFT_1167989 [Hymenopellis radicata]
MHQTLLVLLIPFLRALATPVEVLLNSDIAFEHQLPTISNKFGAPLPPEFGHSSHPGWVYTEAGTCDGARNAGAVCLDTMTCAALSRLSPAQAMQCPPAAETRTARFRELYAKECSAIVDPSSYLGYGYVFQIHECTAICSANLLCKSFNVFLDDYGTHWQADQRVYYTCTLFSRAVTTAMSENNGCQHRGTDGATRISQSAAYNKVFF